MLSLGKRKRKEKEVVESKPLVMSPINTVEEPKVAEKKQPVKKKTTLTPIQEINGIPIEILASKLKTMEAELKAKRTINDQYAEENRRVRDILYPLLEKECYINPQADVVESIVNEQGVNPQNKAYRYNIDNACSIAEALQWIYQLTKPNQEEEIAQVKRYQSDLLHLEEEKKQVEANLQTVLEDKEKLIGQFKLKFQDVIKEKDEVIKEKQVLLLENQKLVNEQQVLTVTNQKLESTIIEKDQEIFRLKEKQKTMIASGKQKVIVSKKLLSQLTEQELLDILNEKKETSIVAEHPPIEANVVTEPVVMSSSSPSEESVPTVDVKEEVELVESIPMTEEFPVMEEELLAPDEFVLDDLEVPADVVVEEPEIVVPSTTETVVGEVVSPDTSFMDELFAEVQQKQQTPATDEPKAKKVEENIQKEYDADRLTQVQDFMYVPLLEKHAYEVEAVDGEGYDVLISKEGEEKTALKYIYFEMEKYEEFDFVFQNTDRVYFLTDTKKRMKQVNSLFTKWLLKQKQRRHDIEFSFTSMDQLKVSGLDELDSY